MFNKLFKAKTKQTLIDFERSSIDTIPNSALKCTLFAKTYIDLSLNRLSIKTNRQKIFLDKGSYYLRVTNLYGKSYIKKKLPFEFDRRNHHLEKT